jgi:hypothetical protein
MGKTLLLALMVMVLATWTGPVPERVLAAGGPDGPVILSAEWESDPEVGEEAYLIVDAVDPHGVITEIQVDFGNSIVFAHAFCLPGVEVGKPYRMIIPNVYDEAGEYTVAVRAISKPHCRARGGFRTSEEVEFDTFVLP